MRPVHMSPIGPNRVRRPLLLPRSSLHFLVTLGLLAGCTTARTDPGSTFSLRSAGFALPEEDVTLEAMIEAEAASAAPRVWPADTTSNGDRAPI